MEPLIYSNHYSRFWKNIKIQSLIFSPNSRFPLHGTARLYPPRLTLEPGSSLGFVLQTVPRVLSWTPTEPSIKTTGSVRRVRMWDAEKKVLLYFISESVEANLYVHTAPTCLTTDSTTHNLSHRKTNTERVEPGRAVPCSENLPWRLRSQTAVNVLLCSCRCLSECAAAEVTSDVWGSDIKVVYYIPPPPSPSPSPSLPPSLPPVVQGATRLWTL